MRLCAHTHVSAWYAHSHATHARTHGQVHERMHTSVRPSRCLLLISTMPSTMGVCSPFVPRIPNPKSWQICLNLGCAFNSGRRISTEHRRPGKRRGNSAVVARRTENCTTERNAVPPTFHEFPIYSEQDQWCWDSRTAELHNMCCIVPEWFLPCTCLLSVLLPLLHPSPALCQPQMQHRAEQNHIPKKLTLPS